MISDADFCLLRELHRTFERLELPEKQREEAAQRILDEAADAWKSVTATDPEYAEESFADEAREVIRFWIGQLATVVETKAAESDQDDVKWDVFEQQLRDKYPEAHEAFVSFAMDKARSTWAEWQEAAPLEVGLEPDEADAEAGPPAELGSAHRENHYVVVGHLHNALVPWEQQSSGAEKPTVGDRARKLFDALHLTALNGEPYRVEVLAAEVAGYAGRYREVLDDALTLARKRVKLEQNRVVARWLGWITAATSVKRLESARGAVASLPKSERLTRVIDERISTLRTLRTGRLTETLKRGFRHLGRVAAAEGGEFSIRDSRKRLLKELGKCREQELLDRLAEEARRVFLAAFLAHRVLVATRRHQVNVPVAGIKVIEPVLVGHE
jgi:hypothetical protein